MNAIHCSSHSRSRRAVLSCGNAERRHGHNHLNRLELEDRLVSLDALHTQDETARALVLEHGADYLLTVKGNQPTVREQIETVVAAPQGDFPPS